MVVTLDLGHSELDRAARCRRAFGRSTPAWRSTTSTRCTSPGGSRPARRPCTSRRRRRDLDRTLPDGRTIRTSRRAGAARGAIAAGATANSRSASASSAARREPASSSPTSASPTARADGGTSWQALYVQPGRSQSGRQQHHARAGRTTRAGSTTRPRGASTWADVAHVRLQLRHPRADLERRRADLRLRLHRANVQLDVPRVTTANGNMYAATGSRHDLYQSTTLTDSPARRRDRRGPLLDEQGAPGLSCTISAHEVAWVATDPTNPEPAVRGGREQHGRRDLRDEQSLGGHGSTWTKLTNPPRTQGHPFNIVVLNDGTLVVSYSGRRAGSPRHSPPVRVSSSAPTAEQPGRTAAPRACSTGRRMSSSIRPTRRRARGWRASSAAGAARQRPRRPVSHDRSRPDLDAHPESRPRHFGDVQSQRLERDLS